MTLPITLPDAYEYTQAVALLSVDGERENSSGTLMLRTYSADEISGAIFASTQGIDGKTLTIRGSFDAHRCDRIHD